MTKPPLTDADYAAVRKSVLQKIERRTWTLRTFQLAFAMLVFVFGSWWLARTKTTHEPRITPAPKQFIAQQPGNPVVTPQPRNPVTHIAKKRHHHKPTHVHPEPQAPLRIELATNDPDIRIIWITNPKESR
jgi:hypothetical protein